MIRVFFVLLLLCICSSASSSEMPTVITFGNHAMTDEALLHITGLKDVNDMSADEIRSRLQTSGLFSAVEVYRYDNTVTIYVREKTTWFVVPYLSKDAAASIYGLAFGKATLYGRDARLVGRYQVGTGNREASLLLKDSSAFNTRWQLGGSFDYEDALHREFGGRTGREVIHRTRNEYIGGSFQVGYRFHPYWLLGVNNYAEHHRFEELSGQFRSGLQWSHRLITEYNRFYVNEGLSDGVAANAYFESTNPVSRFDFRKIGGGVQWGAFRRNRFNWIIKGKMEYGNRLPRYQLFELGGGRLRSFPNQIFRGALYGTVQNDVLLTSVNFWVLRLRPLVYLDWGYAQGGGRTGLGTGFQVYVRDVAIPAVQFFAGYGFHPNGFTVAASIGPNI